MPTTRTYCINTSAYRSLYGRKAGKFIRGYSVSRIVEELKYLKTTYQLEFMKFNDEDFCIKPMSYFEKLADSYAREVGLPFAIMANAKNVDKEMRASPPMNCVSVSLD